jgi:hypothetical protein
MLLGSGVFRRSVYSEHAFLERLRQRRCWVCEYSFSEGFGTIYFAHQRRHLAAVRAYLYCHHHLWPFSCTLPVCRHFLKDVSLGLGPFQAVCRT